MSFFEGRKAVLATMHGKEKAIVPILEKELGLQIVVPEHFDTDQFGTFTREIKRTGNQLEAARRKAQAAMKITGIDLGIASEGSFGSDPEIPFVQSNLELLVLVDEKNLLEITGTHRSLETNSAGEYVSTVEEALAFAKKVGFPQHGVIVRKKEKSKRGIYKGIDTEEALRQRVTKLLKGFFIRKVYIETDMRAHMNPTRMENIAKATTDLVLQCKSECPRCKTPGFSIVATKSGRKCSGCGSVTDSPAAYIRTCQKCHFEKEIEIKHTILENPENCSWCNP
ncbi:MAG: hypothetical protein MUD00_03580 [Candidatus Pacebacteria bacterium]|jgi:hypothetical protein|nr:hypothetical protein [Candidatus Paceibacterota bacterium]